MIRTITICTILIGVFIGTMVFLSNLLNKRVEKLAQLRAEESTTGLALADIQSVRDALDAKIIDEAKLNRTLPTESDVFPFLRATAAKHAVTLTFNPNQSFSTPAGQSANQIPLVLTVEAPDRNTWLGFMGALEQEDYTVSISEVLLTSDSVTNKTSGTITMVFYSK